VDPPKVQVLVRIRVGILSICERSCLASVTEASQSSKLRDEVRFLGGVTERDNCLRGVVDAHDSAKVVASQKALSLEWFVIQHCKPNSPLSSKVYSFSLQKSLQMEPNSPILGSNPPIRSSTQLQEKL
jgi:hypothetical protein